MKIFLAVLASALFLSTSSLAVTGTRYFDVTDAKFDPLHNLSLASTAKVFVDYDQDQVSFIVQPPMPQCLKGMLCVQMMPVPFVTELPIVSIETNECGLRTVVALKDERGEGGSYEKLRLLDSSDVSCGVYADVIQKASYETKFFSEEQIQEIETQSTMNLILSFRSSEHENVYDFVQGEFVQGYPRLEGPVAGELRISPDQVFLRVQSRLNCIPGDACPRYIPRPIRGNFRIISEQKSNCGDRLTAIAKENRNESLREMTLEITDYTSATCDIIAATQISVRFREVLRSSAGRVQVRKAVLFFSPETGRRR